MLTDAEAATGTAAAGGTASSITPTIPSTGALNILPANKATSTDSIAARTAVKEMVNGAKLSLAASGTAARGAKPSIVYLTISAMTVAVDVALDEFIVKPVVPMPVTQNVSLASPQIPATK